MNQPSRLSTFVAVSRLLALACAAVGALVLAGWALGIDRFVRVVPGFQTMKFNTALCFLLSGLALALLTLGRLDRRRRAVAAWLALAVALIALLTGIELLTGADLGIDVLVVADPSGGGAPGRMAPQTAAYFALIGPALLLLARDTSRGVRVAQALAAAGGLIGCVNLLGQLYGVSAFYAVGSFAAVAVQTAACSVLLAAAVLAARPAAGFMRVAASGGPGGVLARRLLPPAVVLPILLGGLLALGETDGHYDEGMGEALLAAGIVVAFATMVLLLAASLERADASRRAAEEALRGSERQFREFAEAMPHIVWATQADGTVEYFNRRWIEFTDMSAEETLARGWHLAIHPDDLEAGYGAWTEALRSGGPYETEFRMRRGDGAYRWLLVRGTAVRDAEGAVVKWVGTNTDVDDLKQAEEELQRAGAELARSNGELEQFAYVASHDLQEPLRAVIGCLQVLDARLDGNLAAADRELLGHAVDGGKRMQELIDDLLAYSRVGTRSSTLQETDLAACVGAALGNLHAAVAESGGAVTHGQLPVVHADPSQLTQIFQNLVGNALKFHGARPPVVHVTGERIDGHWRIGVHDNGIGIEPQYQDRIFGVFQRLHTRTEYRGTGIGLAICKKIAERHGGRLWVESQPGEGSTFYFTLPAEETAS